LKPATQKVSVSPRFIAVLWTQVYLRRFGTSRCCATCSPFPLAL